MKGLDREELGYFETFMQGFHGCNAKAPRFITDSEWVVLQRLVSRGVIEMFLCPSGEGHQHFRVTKLGLEVYEMQKLAGSTPPK